MSKIQPNVVNYIDTQLIECSRLQSAEYNASSNNENKGIFTNTQRSGINIEPGDKISLNSAYVSEVGAGGEVIEFTGIENGDEYVVNYTKQSFPFRPEQLEMNGTNRNPYKVEFEDKIPYIQDDSILDFSEINTNVSETFKVKDNEMKFTTGFYKTSNGEGYFHLPRRFISGHSFTNHSDMLNFDPGAVAQYPEMGGRYQVNTYYHINGDGTIQYYQFGAVTENTNEARECKADTHYKQMLYGDIENGVPSAPVFGKKNDNSRYQIFVRKNTYWYPYSDEQAENYKELFDTGNRNNFLPDIAMNDYVEYKKLQTLTTDVGFDTPSNVASKLTEQLNRSEITPVKVVLKNSSDLGFSATNPNPEQYIYTNKFETPSFQAFKSATEQSFNMTASRRFYAGCNSAFTSSTSDTLIYNQATLDFFNSFQYIGVKRPELYKTGCALNRASRVADAPRNFQVNDTFVDTDGVFQINVRWDEVNASSGRRYLDELKDFFESQDLYPELFDYNSSGLEYSGDPSIRPDDTKLFHCQPHTSIDDEQLGGDQWVYPGDTAVHTSYPRPDNEPSHPMFINYDINASNNTDYDIYGHNKDDLWGGFAYRTKYNNVDFITFYVPTRLVGVMNNGILNVDGTIERDRGCGYDQHFSAYGNSMIGLYCGVNTQDYVDANSIDMIFAISSSDDSISLGQRASANLLQDKTGRLYHTGFDKFKFSYLGALSPVFNFDTTSDRFTIGGLHSPEHIGNFVNAGAKFTSASFNVAEKSTTPDQEVYYINKRLKNNNYCPDMCPYQQSRRIPYQNTPTGVYETQTSVIPFNDNLESGVVYDCFSGIKINDFGTTRENWDNNSIFGIMGFDYNVLNPRNPDNIQTKYNYDFVDHNTNGLMTSALVQARETLSQSQNFMNAPYFNYTMPQCSSPYYAYLNTSRTQAYTNFVINTGFISKVMNPVIVQNTNSAVIRATNLPKKTIRPYYLIRSNIISNDNFIGGRGERLPVIGLVNKINGYADFYSTDGDGTEFTATKPYTIQSITTSIHTPDGKLAPVSDASAVIYKIQKAQNITTNLSELIMGQ